MLKWQWGQLKNSGFQNEHQEGYIEITPDAGAPYRRERFTDVMDIVQGSLTLSKVDYIDFMSWYKHELKQGAIPFLFTDVRYGVDRVARIFEKPAYATNSKYFDVSIKIGFDSDVIEQPRQLTANVLKGLVANGKKLCASKILHV